MCYLPPACVIIARTAPTGRAPAGRLGRPGAGVAERPSLRGEFIGHRSQPHRRHREILILGVHGPKRLVVLLVE